MFAHGGCDLKRGPLRNSRNEFRVGHPIPKISQPVRELVKT
jgi:hypothetical protein